MKIIYSLKQDGVSSVLEYDVLELVTTEGVSKYKYIDEYKEENILKVSENYVAINRANKMEFREGTCVEIPYKTEFGTIIMKLFTKTLEIRKGSITEIIIEYELSQGKEVLKNVLTINIF